MKCTVANRTHRSKRERSLRAGKALGAFCLTLSCLAASLVPAAPQAAKPAKPQPKAEKGHWAFRPPVKPPLPTLDTTPSKIQNPKSKITNPIDLFLLRDLQKKGLSFSPPADKKTLLRRVTFDLIGLPPTPREMDAFLADTAPDAYEKVVDRLLADPRYGERWARHWLDPAGYADSEGILEEDKIRPNAWRYRDYVIQSLNSDKPYDRFLREQIAGDELVDYHNAKVWTPEIDEALTATGFLRTAVDATRDDFNTHQFTEYQYRMLNDTQTILVSSTLGVTLQCARCHDHKYEPFSQKDYYRFQALLAGAIRPTGKLLPTNRRQIVAATAAEQTRAKEVNAQVAAALDTLTQKEAALLAEFRLRALDSTLNTVPEADRTPLGEAARQPDAKRTPEQKALTARYKALLETPPDKLTAAFPDFKQQQSLLQQARAAEEKKRVSLTEIRALYDQDAAPPATHLLIRGEWTRPGDTVEPGIPTILENPRRPFRVPLAAKDAATTGRRTALADWITRPDNPLTARVIVNRLWAHHFGVGLVPSTDNFGLSGTPPTNPELLDWLATTFVSRESRVESRETDAPSLSTLDSRLSTHSGLSWSLKKLHRLMLTSAAYRQASGIRAQAAQKDPENRLLWRQRSRRMEAETLRDAMLAVTGTLDTTMYGEPVNEETRPTGEVAPVGEDRMGRRSIYLLVRRSKPVTLLNTFDAPIMETNCTRRVTSTTPTQALALLNSSFLTFQSHHFAERLQKETANDPAPQSKIQNLKSKIDLAFRLAFGRLPSTAEQASALTFLQSQTARYAPAGSPSAPAEISALIDFCHALLSTNEFAYVD